MRFRVIEAAYVDALAIVKRLGLESDGLGYEFAAELESAYQLSIDRPYLYSPTEDGPPGIEIREYLIRRFSCRVIYSIDEEELVVRVITHTSRKPGWWKRRLKHGK